MIACSQKQEKRNTFVQRMPQWQKLDSKASGEMKVKALKRKKVRKSSLKFFLYFLCRAGGHQNQI